MSANSRWARTLVDELVRHGIRHACLSPGSRNAPLAFALAHESRIRTTTHVDERGAAYFALGRAKATGEPTLVVTTSGTAVANLLPAAVEAYYTGTPLVFLTADRPPELHGIGANQTIEQRNILGIYARLFFDAGIPNEEPIALDTLRAAVGAAIAAATGPPGGAVHVNLPFREPLTPDEDDLAADPREGGPALRAREPLLDPAPLEPLARRLGDEARGWIVLGPPARAGVERQRRVVDAVYALARATGYVVLPDPLSLGRRDDPYAAATYDLRLAGEALLERPRVVLRIGSTPTSKNLLAFLDRLEGAFQFTINEHGRFWSPLGPGHQGIVADPVAALHHLTAGVKRERRRPATGEAAARRLVDEFVADPQLEGAWVRAAAEGLGPHDLIFIGNSLPIRDLDRFVPQLGAPVIGNRGASGIDGILDSAAGAASALGSGGRLRVVLGDLSFLHGVNALAIIYRLRLPIDVIVIDNAGGGIFEFLPVARYEPPFEDLFATPHGLDLGWLGTAFGLQANRPAAPEQLSAVLATPAEGPRLFHVRTDRKRNLSARRATERRFQEMFKVPEAPA